MLKWSRVLWGGGVEAEPGRRDLGEQRSGLGQRHSHRGLIKPGEYWLCTKTAGFGTKGTVNNWSIHMEGVRHGSVRTSWDIKLMEFDSTEDIKPVIGNTNTETSPLVPCLHSKENILYRKKKWGLQVISNWYLEIKPHWWETHKCMLWACFCFGCLFSFIQVFIIHHAISMHYAV